MSSPSHPSFPACLVSSLPRLFASPGHWLSGQALPHRLAVGFSGGADSTALLLALAQLGHRVVAWHVDHGWNEASGELAAKLKRKTATWGIEFHSARLPSPSGKNREAEARQGRFACFSDWAESQQVQTLCLAHHADDQAETVCMRMLQGSGSAGCSGMRRQRDWQGLRIVRPLLHVSRSEIVAALRCAGINWFEDGSNRDTTLLRNRIRHRLFPALRASGTEPLELFQRWQKQAVLLQQRLNGMADAVPVIMQDGAAVVAWDVWRDSSMAVRAVVLQRMHALIFGEGAVLGRRHIRLAEVWRLQGGRSGIDLTRCRLFRRRQTLHLAAVAVNSLR
ncbi:MAG: tRNA lysidine(34) synthetase TilS [Mariprofundaceae bacterium]|nr:tRNA lysidine(34) synthetase TilS [Mariprofundaceae bacterium]